MNMLWPIGGLIFVSLTFKNGNWIDHCVYMIGTPLLLVTILFYILTPKYQSESQESNCIQIKNNFIID